MHENPVQLTDKVLSQWHTLVTYGLFHHFHTHLTGFHINEILQVTFATHLAKQQKQLCLPIGQRVTLYMVAVIVVLRCEFVAQQFYMRVYKVVYNPLKKVVRL